MRVALIYTAALIGSPIVFLAFDTILDARRFGLLASGTTLAVSSLWVLRRFHARNPRGAGGMAETKLFIVAAIMTLCGLGMTIAGLRLMTH